MRNSRKRRGKGRDDGGHGHWDEAADSSRGGREKGWRGKGRERRREGSSRMSNSHSPEGGRDRGRAGKVEGGESRGRRSRTGSALMTV